ncbi:MAG: protein translocase subunit SecD, partial [Candidatus Peribacteraceae bacterium]|nr:protein translocase subunit SecD [Candidatus Peribacteraceae bacterium]
EFTEATAEYEKQVRARADAALRTITVSGSSLQTVGQDLSDQLGVAYTDERLVFKSNLPKGLEDLWDMKPGKIVKREGSITVPETDEAGNVKERVVPGVFLAEVARPRTQTGHVITEAPVAFQMLAEQEKTTVTYKLQESLPLNDQLPAPLAKTLSSMQTSELNAVDMGDGTARVIFLRTHIPGQEQMAASHILIAYKGASSVEASVTRSKEEALALANEVKAKLDAGGNFEELARQYSDGPSAKEAGRLGTFGRGTMVPAFEEAAFKLGLGEISDPVETAFGFHIIRADAAPARSPDTASFDELTVTGEDAAGHAEKLLADLKNGRVMKLEDAVALRTLFFSLLPTGWKDTELNGKHFRSAAVTLDPTTNLPIVQIAFDDEGGKMFQQLTKANVGKRIAIFVGGNLVSAPVVQQEISGGIAVITGSGNFDEAQQLAQDLNTGAIPAPIYLAGQQTIEATLGAEALQMSLRAALFGIFLLMLYMILIYRLLGFIADLALCVYALLFVVILKLPLFFFTSQYIVLTVAGMAGIILSIGMAVDANVLIFERIKEELRRGKALKTAMDIGFLRAWPSIRDGNASTIITCAILFIIGTSIVRGFAVTLGMGVLMSMFTAITVTRWILRRMVRFPFAQKGALYGVRLEPQQFPS